MYGIFSIRISIFSNTVTSGLYTICPWNGSYFSRKGAFFSTEKVFIFFFCSHESVMRRHHSYKLLPLSCQLSSLVFFLLCLNRFFLSLDAALVIIFPKSWAIIHHRWKLIIVFFFTSFLLTTGVTVLSVPPQTEKWQSQTICLNIGSDQLAGMKQLINFIYGTSAKLIFAIFFLLWWGWRFQRDFFCWLFMKSIDCIINNISGIHYGFIVRTVIDWRGWGLMK